MTPLQLILFRKIIAVYCDNRPKHTNTLNTYFKIPFSNPVKAHAVSHFQNQKGIHFKM
jgi:hypothetical protein